MTLAGGTHAFIPGYTPDGTLKAIQNFGVTKIVLVPTMINMLVNHPDVNKYDLSTLQGVLYGASPIPAAVLKKAMITLPNCDFVQGYGMTESSQVVTILSAENHRLPEGHEHYDSSLPVWRYPCPRSKSVTKTTSKYPTAPSVKSAFAAPTS